MAATAPGTSLTGGAAVPPAEGRDGGRSGIWALMAGCAALAVVIALAVTADRYQPLSLWSAVAGGFPGISRPVGDHPVNIFGGQNGEHYIPPQPGTFAASVSLYNTGPFTVTIEAVSMSPPHPDGLWPLQAAGRPLYWTGRMYSGLHPKGGRPITGLSLQPGIDRGVYTAVPVRTSRCYISRAWQVLNYFYVKERFLIFTRWVRMPLTQSLLLNAPAPPVNETDGATVCRAS